MKRLVAFSALSLVLVGVAAAIWLGRDGPDRPASSGVPPESFVTTLASGARRCVPNQIIPPGATVIEMTISTYGRPVKATVGLDAAGSGSAGLRGYKRFVEAQNVAIPISPVSHAERIVNLCIRNIGKAKFQIAGTEEGGPSVRFPTADKFTWIESSGEIAARFQVARVAPFGVATVWVALALALAGLLLGLVAVFKAVRR